MLHNSPVLIQLIAAAVAQKLDILIIVLVSPTLLKDDGGGRYFVVFFLYTAKLCLKTSHPFSPRGGTRLILRVRIGNRFDTTCGLKHEPSKSYYLCRGCCCF